MTPGIRPRQRKDGSVTSRLPAPRGPYTAAVAVALQSWSDLLVT